MKQNLRDIGKYTNIYSELYFKMNLLILFINLIF